MPFRDSKLTRMLQTSLGGNSRTAIICTISPAAGESLSSLTGTPAVLVCGRMIALCVPCSAAGQMPDMVVQVNRAVCNHAHLLLMLSSELKIALGVSCNDGSVFPMLQVHVLFVDTLNIRT